MKGTTTATRPERVLEIVSLRPSTVTLLAAVKLDEIKSSVRAYNVLCHLGDPKGCTSHTSLKKLKARLRNQIEAAKLQLALTSS